MQERKLSKEQAEKISQITSSIFPQGSSWVMKEWDLEKGTEKLTRGLSHKSARKKLKNWRREKIEELLREERESPAYILRLWQQNPNWQNQGIWHFFQNHWYTNKCHAQKNLEQFISENESEQKNDVYLI